MSDEKKKSGNLQRMKEVLKKNKGEIEVLAKELDEKKKLKVAAAATPPVPKKPKNNYRTAKARDVRTKAHGRMPVNLQVFAEWDGAKWVGKLYARTVPPGVEKYKGDIVNDLELEDAICPKKVKEFTHEADGLFRLMEELDVMFWEWLAKHATAEEKNRLTFAPDPPCPAPWENPSPAASTATESH